MSSQRISVRKSQPLPVVGAVNRAATGAALFSVSDSGTLAYVPGGSDFALVTVDRNDRASSLLDEVGTFWMPGLSPDGKRLAVFSREGKTYDVWIYDIVQGARIRLTTDGFSGWPIWTRNGERITFSSKGNLCWASADGSGTVQMLLDRDNVQRPVSWSPDNKTLAFQEINPDTGADVYLLHLGTQEPEALLHTAFDERAPQFSPDGRWLAYVSNESGRNEVYVRAYLGVDQKWIVSVKGGSEPRWSSDGREILYRQSGKMMVAVVTTEPTFSIGERRELFDGPYDSNPESCLPAYDVTPDGEHFVTSMPDPVSIPRQINIVLNWFDELERLVPTRD
jgi:Tol biopolymer transport system component